jgi:hypothetical protein
LVRETHLVALLIDGISGNISMPFRRAATNLLLLSISVLLGLGLLEAGTRMLLGDRIVLFPRNHTSAHYGEYTIRRLRPNSHFWHTSLDGSWEFTTNAQGFRADHDYAIEKPKGRIRVMVLGDSQAEGFEARQDRIFSIVAERYLKARGVDAEVLNTGVSGFGTSEELVYLENEGVRYHPDAVVLAFNANDFDDNMKDGLFGLDEGQLVARGREFIPGVKIMDVIDAVGPLRWLSENSYLYSWVLNTVWDRAKASLLSAAEKKGFEEYVMPTGAAGTYAKALQARLLERLHNFCRARGIPLIVIDMPQPPQRDLKSRFDFESSIPADFVQTFRENSDVLLLSDDVLGKYRGAAEFVAPHGHRHINDFTHQIYGVAIGETVLARLFRRAAP